ncbi:MAG: DUF3352 domain-containing protein [Synechococcales bacterium]|nr:DUF3352 domain-containing protein [Synechococcales bacterium]
MRLRYPVQKSRSLLSLMAGSTLAASIALVPPSLAQVSPSSNSITNPAANLASSALAATSTANPTPNPATKPTQPVVAPAVSQILPYDTAGIFFVNSDAAAWEDLSKFGLFPRDITTPGFVFESIAPSTNYDLDIQPWLTGHWAIALLPGEGKPNQRVVTLAAVKDEQRIPRFITQVKAGRRLDPLIEKEYKGVKILLWEPKKLNLAPEPGFDEPGMEVPPGGGELDVPTFAPRSDDRASVKLKVAKRNAVQPKTAKLDLSTLLVPSGQPAIATSSPPVQPLPAPGTVPLPDKNPETLPEEEVPPTSPEETPDWAIVPGFAIAYIPSNIATNNSTNALTNGKHNIIGYIVTSQSLEAVQTVIDGTTQEKSLASHPDFQRTIADPRFSKSLMAGYSDYNQLLKLSTDGMPVSLQNLYRLPPFALPKGTDPQLEKRFEEIYGAFDGYVWAEPEGLRVQGTVHLTESLPAEIVQQVNSPNGLKKRMPEVNYAMMTSYNLAFFWRALEAGLSADPEYKKGIESFRLFAQNSFGIDDRDLFSWMDQEYGAFSFPSTGGLIPTALPNLDIGLGSMFQTSDRPAAEKAIQKIEAHVKKLGGKQVQIKAVNVNGQALTSIEVPGPKGKGIVSVVAYGWVAPDTLLILSGKDTAINLVPTPWRSLDQSSHFNAAMAPLPQENLGTFYANPSAMLALANQFGLGQYLNTPMPEDPETTIASMVGSIRSVSGTSAITNRSATSDGFLSISSRVRPKLTAADFLTRGTQRLEMGNDKGAIEALSRSLRLDSQVSETHSKRGEARLNIRDPQGAIEDFNNALSLNSQNREALAGRGMAKTALFDYPGAIADFTTVIDKLQPTSDDYSGRGAAKSALADYAGSLADANEALKLDAENMIALNNRCFAKGMLGDLTGALADCNQGIEFDTEGRYLATLYADRCFVRAKQGEKDALTDCGSAIEMDEDDGFVWESQGYARQALGDKKGAKFSFEKALKLFQDDPISIERINRAIAALD